MQTRSQPSPSCNVERALADERCVLWVCCGCAAGVLRVCAGVQMAKDEVKRQREILAATYGLHVPLRMQMESEILSQYRRLPTLQSSMVGLDTLAGRDTDINISDVFGATPHGSAPPARISGHCSGRPPQRVVLLTLFCARGRPLTSPSSADIAQAPDAPRVDLHDAMEVKLGLRAAPRLTCHPGQH